MHLLFSSEESQPGFETQDIHHQKFKTGIPVVPQKGTGVLQEKEFINKFCICSKYRKSHDH